METFLVIDQQLNRNKRVGVYAIRKEGITTVGFDDITVNLKQFIPKILNQLDSKLYINAVFLVKNSTFEAMLIVKHNNLLKYCLTAETKLHISVRI